MGVIVNIIGENNNSDEYNAGLKLKSLIESLPGNVLGEVVIYPNATLFGQAVKDVDIVVLGELQNYAPSLKYYENGDAKMDKIFIESFCMVIEVKSHNASAITRQGTDWFVPYGRSMHNVTNQSNGQKTSLFTFFNNQVGISPFVTNVIWFTETLHSEIDNLKIAMNHKLDTNALSGDCDFKEFMQQVVLQSNVYRRRNQIVINAIPSECELKRFETAMEFFSRQKMGMGELTRKRVEQITRKTIEGGLIHKEKGKLSIYRGRAGTGKTIGLIQTAINLVDEEDCRVLILTYNKLLVADIKRLFALADLPDMFDYRCVEINTLQAYFYRLINKCIYDGRLKSSSFIENYDSYMSDAVETLKDESIRAIISEQCMQDNELNWNYVFVDEAQDWTEAERDVLLSIFNAEQIVIADGGQQFVRKIKPCDWLIVRDRSNVKLKKCLRQKSNLIKFINRINEQYESNDNRIVGSENMVGGKVIVVANHPQTLPTIKKELSLLIENGNAYYDCLCMVPPGFVCREFDNRRFKYADEFCKNGIDIWDGTNPINRDNTAIPSEQIRVIQYESARGLEGWISVCLNLDQFIESKMNAYNADDNRNELLLESEEDLRKKYLLNWLMVPLTRAIDTLIITLADEYSDIGRMLAQIAEENPDFIDWI